MSGLRRPFLMACCLGWIVALPARAEVFKTVDDSGAPEFSERRQAGTHPSEKLKLAPAKTPEQSVSKEPIVHQGTGGLTVQVKPKDPKAKPKPTKEQLAKMQELCTKAKASAAQLSGENGERTNRLQYVDKNGERAFLTEDQVQERLKDMKQKIKDYCVK
ncbi:MAG: hypothetical protein HY749_19925 [Gammaproteobacteria bacterium]|nr:hypothetical protein [Gammaproteobacteria bacterium]MBI5615341.1 hypothetical protein [Gammaproteobacteria bacterium]